MVFIKVHVGFVNVQDGLQLIAAGTVRPALILARRDVLERVLLTVSVSFRLPVLVSSVIFGVFAFKPTKRHILHVSRINLALPISV